MAYDFKKEFKDLYAPKTKPALIDVPAMTFVAVAGCGDPNEEGGAYKQALELLYAFSYAVKMSKMGDWQPEGYFDFVVPPLEGFWWNNESGAFDGTGIADKSSLMWISLIRQPDFVNPEVFEHVCSLVIDKKPELETAIRLGSLRLVRFSEGPCAQVMHVGSYDDEPATIAELEEFIASQGLRLDIAEGNKPSPQEILETFDCGGAIPQTRLHHEIYLGDPRRTKPENLKTIIRHPVA